MAKINTTNYQPVTAWNGTQDLFVVEQPDGTKVATPEQVKQYVEAGDFEATGEIKDGHGNILKDMAKSATVDAEIGDLSQTGLTGDSVAAQLGDIKNFLRFLNFTHFVQVPFTTSVLDSIKAAFENATIPVDIFGITVGIVNGNVGSLRVIFIAQNQSLSTTQTRYAAIYFGAYAAPRFLQKQDGTNWTDVAL